MKIPTNNDIMEQVFRFSRFLGRYGIVFVLTFIAIWWGYRHYIKPLEGPAAMYQMGHWQEGDIVEYDGQKYKVTTFNKYYSFPTIDIRLEEVNE